MSLHHPGPITSFLRAQHRQFGEIRHDKAQGDESALNGERADILFCVRFGVEVRDEGVLAMREVSDGWEGAEDDGCDSLFDRGLGDSLGGVAFDL